MDDADSTHMSDAESGIGRATNAASMPPEGTGLGLAPTRPRPASLSSRRQTHLSV